MRAPECRKKACKRDRWQGIPHSSGWWPPEIKANISTLISRCLDPVRELWGKPIIVNSGFRCPVLNSAVGGSKTSQHMRGEAADITTGTREGNARLFDMIVESGLPFDQLIDEYGYKWIHISYSSKNRKQILHLK